MEFTEYKTVVRRNNMLMVSEDIALKAFEDYIKYCNSTYCSDCPFIGDISNGCEKKMFEYYLHLYAVRESIVEPHIDIINVYSKEPEYKESYERLSEQLIKSKNENLELKNKLQQIKDLVNDYMCEQGGN